MSTTSPTTTTTDPAADAPLTPHERALVDALAAILARVCAIPAPAPTRARRVRRRPAGRDV